MADEPENKEEVATDAAAPEKAAAPAAEETTEAPAEATETPKATETAKAESPAEEKPEKPEKPRTTPANIAPKNKNQRPSIWIAARKASPTLRRQY